MFFTTFTDIGNTTFPSQSACMLSRERVIILCSYQIKFFLKCDDAAIGVNVGKLGVDTMEAVLGSCGDGPIGHTPAMAPGCGHGWA